MASRSANGSSCLRSRGNLPVSGRDTRQSGTRVSRVVPKGGRSHSGHAQGDVADPERQVLEQALQFRQLTAERLLTAREGLLTLRYRSPAGDWESILVSLASADNHQLEMKACLAEALRLNSERSDARSPEHKRRRC